MSLLGYALVFLFVFWGTEWSASCTRIRFLGWTLYERQRHTTMLTTKTTITLRLGSGSDGDGVDPDDPDDEDDVDETDDRDLWDRLEDAGFVLIEEERDLRVSAVGAIKASEYTKAKCYRCLSEVFTLREAYMDRPPCDDKPIGHVQYKEVASVCENCGCVVEYSRNVKVGRLSPLMTDTVNFFDVLEFLEGMNGDDAEDTTDEADVTLLEGQRDSLERQLGMVRTALMRKKHELGAGDAFREADRTLEPSAPDDQPLPDLESRKTLT